MERFETPDRFGQALRRQNNKQKRDRNIIGNRQKSYIFRQQDIIKKLIGKQFCRKRFRQQKHGNSCSEQNSCKNSSFRKKQCGFKPEQDHRNIRNRHSGFEEQQLPQTGCCSSCRNDIFFIIQQKFIFSIKFEKQRKQFRFIKL